MANSGYFLKLIFLYLLNYVKIENFSLKELTSLIFFATNQKPIDQSEIVSCKNSSNIKCLIQRKGNNVNLADRDDYLLNDEHSSVEDTTSTVEITKTLTAEETQEETTLSTVIDSTVIESEEEETTSSSSSAIPETSSLASTTTTIVTSTNKIDESTAQETSPLLTNELINETTATVSTIHDTTEIKDLEEETSLATDEVLGETSSSTTEETELTIQDLSKDTSPFSTIEETSKTLSSTTTTPITNANDESTTNFEENPHLLSEESTLENHETRSSIIMITTNKVNESTAVENTELSTVSNTFEDISSATSEETTNTVSLTTTKKVEESAEMIEETTMMTTSTTTSTITTVESTTEEAVDETTSTTSILTTQEDNLEETTFASTTTTTETTSLPTTEIEIEISTKMDVIDEQTTELFTTEMIEETTMMTTSTTTSTITTVESTTEETVDETTSTTITSTTSYFTTQEDNLEETTFVSSTTTTETTTSLSSTSQALTSEEIIEETSSPLTTSASTSTTTSLSVSTFPAVEDSTEDSTLLSSLFSADSSDVEFGQQTSTATSEFSILVCDFGDSCDSLALSDYDPNKVYFEVSKTLDPVNGQPAITDWTSFNTPTLNLGKECVIPFEYQNVSFNYCTNKDGIFQCAIDDSFETFDECNTGQFLQFYSKDGSPNEVNATIDVNLASSSINYMLSIYVIMFCDESSRDCGSAEDFVSISLQFQDTRSNRVVEEKLLEIRIDDLDEQNKWQEITAMFDIDAESKRNFKTIITIGRLNREENSIVYVGVDNLVIRKTSESSETSTTTWSATTTTISTTTSRSSSSTARTTSSTKTTRTSTRTQQTTQRPTTTTRAVVEPPAGGSDDLLAILLGIFIPLAVVSLIALVLLYLVRTGRVTLPKWFASNKGQEFIDDDTNHQSIPLEAVDSSKYKSLGDEDGKRKAYGATSSVDDDELDLDQESA